MDNQVKFHLRRLLLYYYNFRYSAYFPVMMPILIISIGLLTFILFILPQMNNLFSVQEEVQATQSRIAVMRENNRFLSNLNKADIDRDFTVATEALPSNKDFIGILNAISKAALSSNVSLGDYDFFLGTVNTDTSEKNVNPDADLVNISLKIDGNITDINNFMLEIEKKLPLAEIKTVNFSDNTAEVLLVFHVKPLPDLDINYSDQLEYYSQSERNMLKKVYLWSDR